MSGLRHGRETVLKATQITDKLCLAWGQRMSRREVQEEAAEGICGHRSGLESTYKEQGWIPPLRSKSRAKHLLGVWICCSTAVWWVTSSSHP